MLVPCDFFYDKRSGGRVLSFTDQWERGQQYLLDSLIELAPWIFFGLLEKFDSMNPKNWLIDCLIKWIVTLEKLFEISS